MLLIRYVSLRLYFLPIRWGHRYYFLIMLLGRLNEIVFVALVTSIQHTTMITFILKGNFPLGYPSKCISETIELRCLSCFYVALLFLENVLLYFSGIFSMFLTYLISTVHMNVTYVLNTLQIC